MLIIPNFVYEQRPDNETFDLPAVNTSGWIPNETSSLVGIFDAYTGLPNLVVNNSVFGGEDTEITNTLILTPGTYTLIFISKYPIIKKASEKRLFL